MWNSMRSWFNVTLYISLIVFQANCFASDSTNLLLNPSRNNIHASTPIDPTVAGIYTEVHVASGSTQPVPHCSAGGSYASGSMQAVTGGFTYNCYISFSNSDISSTATAHGQLYASEVNGWRTVVASPLDMATLQYPNGFPFTTFSTNTCFSFGPNNGYYSYANLLFQVNGVQAGNIPNGGDDCSVTASLSMQVAPGAWMSFYKNVWHNWSDYCYSNFAVSPAMIGQNVYLDCCPTYWENTHLPQDYPAGNNDTFCASCGVQASTWWNFWGDACYTGTPA